MKKLVNGVLVNLTQEEINAVLAERASTNTKQVPLKIKQCRDQKLYSGLTVGGVSIASDNVTQSRLIAAMITAKEDPDYTINWKTDDGFVLLDADTIITIATAMREHTQKCFDVEALMLDIDDLTQDEIETKFEELYIA